MASEEIVFGKSQRNKTIVYHQGYSYNEFPFTQTGQVGNRYRCRNRKCPGKLVLSDKNEVIDTEAHSHAPNNNELEAEIVCKNIRKRALSTTETSQAIVRRETTNVDDEVVLKLPKLKSMKDMVTKSRNKAMVTIRPEDEDIPDVLRYTFTGDLFLHHDSGIYDSERFVLLGSKFQLDSLKRCKTWLIDGTFKMAPSSFTQLISIHGFIVAKSYPLVYILLQTKKESAYKNAFEYLKTLIEYVPVTIITDFECGLINACQTVFHGSKAAGCLFHFGQANWRKIQQCGLVQPYKAKAEIYDIYQACQLRGLTVSQVTRNDDRGGFNLPGASNTLFFYQKTFISPTAVSLKTARQGLGLFK